MKWQNNFYATKAKYSEWWLYFWEESESKGKYLFFSQDPFALLSLWSEIIAKYPWLNSWKISEPIEDEDCVLCIFSNYKNSTYDKEFREDLRKDKDIHYSWWKSHTATLKWKYSKKYAQ